MVRGLGDLGWNRVDVIFDGPVSTLKAHEWICGKNAHMAAYGASFDVCRHVASELAGGALAGGDVPTADT